MRSRVRLGTLRITGDVPEAGSSTTSTSGMGTKSEAGTIKLQSFQHVMAHCQQCTTRQPPNHTFSAPRLPNQGAGLFVSAAVVDHEGSNDPSEFKGQKPVAIGLSCRVRNQGKYPHNFANKNETFGTGGAKDFKHLVHVSR